MLKSGSNVWLRSQTFGKSDSDSEFTRVFIVEDLCPELLELIGRVFNFPHPESFARHMDGANHKMHTSKPFEKWKTAQLRSPSATIRWNRPVYLRRDCQNIDLPWKILESLQVKNGKNIVYSNDTEGLISKPLLIPGRGDEVPSVVYSTLTNTYRRGFSISATKAEEEEEVTENEPFLWEERATVIFPDSPKQKSNVLLLLDPLPLMVVRYSLDRNTQLPYVPIRRQRHIPSELPGFDVTRGVMKMTNANHSTADDLCFAAKQQLGTTGAFTSLFTVILQDMKDSFELMNNTLEEITNQSMDDVKLQKRLNHWRSLLVRMQREARALPEEFNQFLGDLYDVVPEDLRRLADDLMKSSQLITEKILLCQNGLRADMSLLESRRGIAEAESVTRLTELAFIFIPLSFVAAVFSMQITELETRVPASTFVVAVLIVIIPIYGLRLLVRARLVKNVRQAIRRDIHKRYHIDQNEAVPLATYIRFIVRWAFFGDQGEVWACWLVLSAAGVSIVPVALLWSQIEMDTSFKIMGTIIFVPMGLAMAWLIVSAMEMGPKWNPKKVALWLSRYFGGRRMRRKGRDGEDMI